MNFKKGDIISNCFAGPEGLQWVKLLSDIKPNWERNTRYEHPYKANVIHVKGKFMGETVEDYYICKDSILIKRSEEFFNRIIKPFEFV